MKQRTVSALTRNFLGNSPVWYKQLIILFLFINPILLHTLGPTFTGWVLIFEFILTLAMALKCYPLQPGGLLALEAIIIGMTNPDSVYAEVSANLEVILLLMFMVAGIYFMKDLLLWLFSKLLVKVRSKTTLSLLFSLFAAFLSAFLDALTVTAVLITVGVGFFSVYHKVASGKQFTESHDHSTDHSVQDERRQDLENFRAFLRSLMMHGAVGTALGGVCTLVGEPQNLLIAQRAGWDFVEFFLRMAPITLPVLVVGLATCFMLEKSRRFGYGARLPESVRAILVDYAKEQSARKAHRDRVALWIQAGVGLFLIFALALHLAEVGLIGLTVIILLTAFNGITEEHQIGKAFEEALPFTALLVVFFAIVSVIHEQHLFAPIITYALSLELSAQPAVFFLANGLLSAISDNVFVATVYINEVYAAFNAGEISREHFDSLVVAINTGTNIPSVATPNGQAAFLFLLTSAIAPLIRLSYGTMVWMALPYTVLMTLTGLLMVMINH